MKKVAFAWVTKWVDFSTYEEAKAYAKECCDKDFFMWDSEKSNWTRWDIPSVIYENGNTEMPYTIRVMTPYKNYEIGM